MIFQKKRNRWSCTLTAFAMAVGIDQEEILKEIGHDGSEIINPHLPEPLCRRGFDPREFIYWGIKHNIKILHFERDLYRELIDGSKYVINKDKDFFELLKRNTGVLSGRTKNGLLHSVAWDGYQIYDPEGCNYGLDRLLTIHFFMVIK